MIDDDAHQLAPSHRHAAEGVTRAVVTVGRGVEPPREGADVVLSLGDAAFEVAEEPDQLVAHARAEEVGHDALQALELRSELGDTHADLGERVIDLEILELARQEAELAQRFVCRAGLGDRLVKVVLECRDDPRGIGRAGTGKA